MSPPKDKSLYDILGVKETASADEIKRSYRDLAKRFHPDRTGGDKSKESRFKEISAAYDVLSDDGKRKKYDAMRQSNFMGPDGVPFDLSEIFGGGRGGPAGAGFGDLFSQLFNQAQAGRAGHGGARVIFEERGGPTGRGPRRPGRHVPWEEHGGPAHPVEEILRVDGHEFIRRGHDVYLDFPLTIEEAVLGAKVEVPTLDGRVTVSIPPGTSSGKKLRLRGKGVSGRGDEYVVVQIVVPEHLDDEAKQLLVEFSRKAPVKPRR
jgi:curved DNA-binding protein